MAQPGSWMKELESFLSTDISKVARERQREQFIQDYMARTGYARWMAEAEWYHQLSPEEQRSEHEAFWRELDETRSRRTAAVLDLLMRGEYASAGFAQSLAQGDVLGALPAAWRGLTGQERITYGDLAHQYLPEDWPDWVKSGAGFLAGVLLDPTTWIGVGGLTRAGRAAQVGGHLAPTLSARIATGQQGLVTFAGRAPARRLQSRVAQALEPLSQRIADTAAVQELVSMFSTKPMGPAAKVEEIIRNREQIARYLVDRAKRQNVELAMEIADLERRMGVPQGTLERHITREVERARPETMLRARRREVTETVPVTETVMRQAEQIRERPTINPEWYELQYEVQRGDTLSALAQRHNTTVEKILSLNPQIRDPDVIRAGDTIRLPAPEEVTPHVESIRAEQPARLAREQAAGLPTAEWVSEELEYFGRIATPEFEEFMRRTREPAGRAERLDVRHASQRQRHLPDLPIEELNRANREGRLGFDPERGGYFVSDTPLPRSQRAFRGFDGDLFEENPFVVEYVREARSIRAIQSAEALDDIRALGLEEGWIREAPGQLTADGKVQVDPRLVPDGWELLQTPALGGKFDGLMVRSDIAPHIRGYYEKATNQQELHWALKAFDSVQNWWKAQTLSPFPSYHARNLAGDVWNNLLADVNPRYYVDSAMAMAGRKGRLTIRSGPMKGQKIPYDEAMELAAMHGALETGFFHTQFRGGSLRDVDQIRLAQASRAFREGKWGEALRRYRQAVTPREFLLREINPFHQKGLLVRGGRALGQSINNHTRLAHFFDRLARGFTPEQATKSVHTFLFDYTDVTRFESEVMRRIAPFYTWSRKNLPLQFKKTFEQPYKVTTPLKAERELRMLMGHDVPDPEEIPDWIRESFPIYLGRTAEGDDRWWTAMRWWPWAELFEPVETPARWAGGMLTPILRVPIELATNYDLYFRQPIVPPELHAAGETRLRNFLGMSMPASTAHVLGQQRLLSELDRLNPWNIFGEDRPYRNDPEHAARWVRFLTGMNIYEVDPMQTAMMRRLGERRILEALQSEARRAGRAGDEEGLEYILERMRRRMSQ